MDMNKMLNYEDVKKELAARTRFGLSEKDMNALLDCLGEDADGNVMAYKDLRFLVGAIDAAHVHIVLTLLMGSDENDTLLDVREIFDVLGRGRYKIWTYEDLDSTGLDGYDLEELQNVGTLKANYSRWYADYYGVIEVW